MMEESSTYLCNKCGKSFNHKMKLAVHKKYRHPKSASLSRRSDNFDQSESGSVKPREFSDQNKKLHLTKETNVEIVGREVMGLNNESFKKMQEIPLQRSGSLSGDKSSPALTDSDDYEVAQERPQNESPEGPFQNENSQPSIGTSPSSDPPSQDKHTKNVKRKRYGPDSLREPQNKLLKISTASKFSGTLPEESFDGVKTIKIQSSTKKQLSKLEEHSSEKRFSCKFCEYRTNYSSHLRNHERTHTGEKPYKCKHCSYSATESSQLKNHERTHSGEKPYKCKYCSFSATDCSNLRSHERTHTGEKPFKCHYCDYSSRTKSCLQNHERTHTGEKPYQCGSCHYAAKSQANMLAHVKTHTGEKPYKCDICSYSTARNASLGIHKRMHTGEKPYKCQNCGYRSTDSSNLRRHERTHTIEQ